MDSAPARIPTYAERHGKLNRLADKNPWVKVYVAAILLAEAVGCYRYAVSKDVEVIAGLDRYGFFGILGAIFLVFLPLIIIRLREAHDEAEL